MFYECNIVVVNIDITFELGTLGCVRCYIGLIPFLVHKCWIAVARTLVFVYDPVCFYVHSCHIKAAVVGWGESRCALKDILMTAVCEGRVSPGLPPTCPSWLLCHFTPCLGWILGRHQGLYLTLGCSDSTLASPHAPTENKLLHCASVYMCMHTSFLSGS